VSYSQEGAHRLTNLKDCPSPLLIVAHPGHELRVHGWMEKTHPVVCVLTDGSGHTGEGRLESTSQVLDQVHASKGSVYGIVSDRGIYSAIMDGDIQLFADIADALCSSIIAQGADCVVGDSVEGYNPSHDICRLLINAAVRMANERTRKRISSFDFPLVGAPGDCPDDLKEDAMTMMLDDDALERKLRAADHYPELKHELQTAMSMFGVAPFRTECLRPIDVSNWIGWASPEKPFYEIHGEKRVAEGIYDTVLRFRQHVYPVAEALRDHSLVMNSATR
jgi:hypothetical protein